MSEADVAFLVPWDEIEMHERRLPHWQQGRAALFVTWRLADALPQDQLAAWLRERELWLARHPQPWDALTRKTYAEQFGQCIDRWLDSGHGSCLLRQPAVREELNRVLQHFNDIRYRLHAWVAMPNHVHVLFSPSGMEPVARTIGAWKGVSARRIHQRLGGGQERLNTEGTVPQTRAGVPALPNRPIQSTGDSYRLWQPEYWDTLIRSAAHLAACRRYIANNPARASLANTEYTLWVEDGDH